MIRVSALDATGEGTAFPTVTHIEPLVQISEIISRR